MDLNRENSFGAIERQQKPEDVLINSFGTATPTPPTFNMELVGTGTIEDQYHTPSCGAHAGTYLKNSQEAGFRGSPEYLWKAMRQADGLSPDQGSNMLTIMQVLQKRGVCSYTVFPNNATVSNAQYADPSTLTPTDDLNAADHKIGQPYAFTFNPTFQQIKDAIFQHGSALLLLRVGAEWWTGANGVSSWAEKDILPLDPNREPISSGHFVLAKAFDENYIYCINEWSDQWGRNGWGYFGENYAIRVSEMGTAVNPSATYIFSKVLRLGSTGFDVKQLQRVLNLTQDGIFGQQTQSAVEAFQKAHGLITDGVVGNKTNEALNANI